MKKTKKILFFISFILLLIPAEAMALTGKEWYEEGLKFFQGQGYNQDDIRAQYCFEKAAALNYGKAMNAMGYMYTYGKGLCDKDYVKAAEWYEKAIRLKQYNAYVNYAYLYYSGGYGLKKDMNRAIELIRTGAYYKEAKAYQWLGFLYQNGYGVPKNLAEAKAWYQKGADAGDEVSIQRLKELGVVTNNTTTENPREGWADIRWLSETTTSQQRFRVKAGITSPTEVTNVRVRVNGQEDRGIKTVAADGYDLMVDREVTLAQGVNTIRIDVTNAKSTYYIEKKVTCETNPGTNTTTAKTKERRVALVIGNGNYEDSNMKLKNPVNDAADVTAKLVKLGFVVVRSLNQTKKGMEDAIQLFSQKAKNSDVALFYYAGHGLQCSGSNYMVPVDAKLPSEEYVPYNCTNADLVLDVMEKSGCKMKIVILDACRNNPFSRSWHRSTSGGGLAVMNAPKGTFIAYSTAPGDVALDGGTGQRNSPYTSALLQTFDKKGLSITDFFQEVLERVATTTNEKQNPWTSNSFRGKFVFNPE